MTISLQSAALIFLGSAGACVLVGHVAIKWLAVAGCVQPVRHEDCPPLMPILQSKQGTPTMGGLFLLAVACLVAACSGGLAHRSGWLVLLAILTVGGVGLADDLMKFRGANALGLRIVPKLAVALGAGALVGALFRWISPGEQGIMIPWLARTIDLGWGSIPFAMLVIAGCAHAVNLTDGMDGLAAGCSALVLAVLGLWALSDPSQHVVVPWCASLAGACTGFLWFNSFPASVFLGDVGALGIGAALGVVSLLTHTPIWLAVIGGVFVLEAMSVILQVASYKWRDKRRIFRVAPLHHHFHVGGMSEPKVIVRFWIVGLFLAVLGLAAAS